MANSTPVDEIAPNELTLNSNGQALKLTYYANEDPSVANNDVTIAIIHIHGISKNARDYLRSMIGAAHKANLYQNSMIIAPQFLDEEDYNFYNLSNDYLHWQSNPSGRVRGANSLNSPASLSSYEVLDELIYLLVNNNPNLCQIIVSGHSAGAQMVNRYAAVNVAENNISIPVRYVVANPSTFLYLNDQRAISGTLDQFAVPNTSCNLYNDWKYGLQKLNNFPYIVNIGNATIIDQFKDRDVVYLHGALDNDPLDPTLENNCQAQLQGDHRLERGLIYFNYLKDYYQTNHNVDVSKNHKQVIVPGVGHSNTDLLRAFQSVGAIFNIESDPAVYGYGWQLYTPALTGVQLYDVFFLNPSNGWIVGDDRTLLRTTDGGATWFPPSNVSGTNTSTIRSVFFTDQNNGWASRSSGRVLKTTDGGDTWNTINSNVTSSTLRSVHFIDNQTGWATGNSGTIIKSTNGGDDWSTQNSGTNELLYHIFFIDAQTGWAVGENGAILKTTNGGSSWTIQTSNTSEILRRVFFLDQQIGWIAGHNGLILHTTDGGSSWTPQVSSTTSWFRDIHFIGSEGWAVASNGRIVHTYDYGENWHRQETGITDNLWGVFAADKNHVWAVGSAGVVLSSKLGGQACLLSVDLGQDTTLSGTDTIRLEADNCYARYDFIWNTGQTTPYLIIPGSSLPSGNTIFSVTVSDGPGCKTVDDLIITTTNPIPQINVTVNAFLEGAYDDGSGMMTTQLLQRSLFPVSGQPYTVPPWNYQGTEGVGWQSSDYPAGAVDWVLVSLRSSEDAQTTIGQAAGVLLEDGSVSVDIIPNSGTVLSQYYVVLDHRNHLIVMSPNLVQVTNNEINYDFTNANSYNPGAGFGQKQVGSDWVLFGGNGDQLGIGHEIIGADIIEWQQLNGNFNQYSPSDFTMDGDINADDKILWSNNNGIYSLVPK